MRFPPGAEVWTPVGWELAEDFWQNEMDVGVQRGLGVLYVVERLARAARWSRRGRRWTPSCRRCGSRTSRGGATRRVDITPLTDHINRQRRGGYFVLLGGGMLLLLIACAKVTGLMIVGSQSRRRNVAVQCALGIGRGRLFCTHLMETLLATGCAAGGDRTGVGGAAAPGRARSPRTCPGWSRPR